MKIIKIKNGVKLQLIKNSDDYSIYYCGKVIYDDETIDFGKIIIYSDFTRLLTIGRFLYDDKYIYECMVWDQISNVFNIENRCEVKPISELKIVRELYKKNHPKEKLK